jgi:hypothetical protein
MWKQLDWKKVDLSWEISENNGNTHNNSIEGNLVKFSR